MAGKPNNRNRNAVRDASIRPKKPYWILLAVAVVGASILGYSMSRKPAAPDATAVTPPDPVTAGPPQPYISGKADAPVKIEEFADFECPACGRFATITEPDVRKRLIDSGLASLSYYDFPLPQHRNSQSASSAAACANEQGKFWPMHDQLFAGQDKWNTEATDNPKPMFSSYAAAIGLDAAKFEACYDAKKYQK
ncbi:MAG: thioredoxin domain-containing protein, partial [Gemmatimonadales bacterium]